MSNKSPLISVGLPLLNAKNVAWLAMEGLMRQEGMPHWELLIYEENNKKKFGPERLHPYKKRLRTAGCLNVSHVMLPQKIHLSEKWVRMGKTIWLRAADWLEIAKAVVVMDLGCGPGHMAQIIHDKMPKLQQYFGYDFSQVAIRSCLNRGLPSKYVFERRDLRKGWPIDVKLLCHYVILESLEHILEDLEIVRLIPPQSPVFISLPINDSDGHVRWFTSEGSIRARYGKLLKIDRLYRVEKQHWAVEGTRR